MSVVNNNLLLTADAGVSQYQVSRSLRFNSADSAYINRTFSTPTTQGTFTLAMWVKRSALGTAQSLFGVSINHSFGFTTGNALNLTFGGTSALTTTAVFRDTSAWYHIVWTQSGTSHTVYVNGTSQGTATATSSVFNTAVAHQMGASNTANYFNGYLADVHFIDGQALTPSSFTETNATTGQLVPNAYTSSYGTNGFRLNFSDNSAATAAALGADSSGNGNNWTPNNLSVTAGAGNDSLVDTPTSYGTDTGAGGEVRGNYATLNPLSAGSQITLSNGNLDYSHLGNGISCRVYSTIAMSSGKWYCEHTVTTANQMHLVGIAIATDSASQYMGQTAGSYGYYAVNGRKYNNGSQTVYGATYTNGDIIGIAFDADNRTLTFYKNGVSQGAAFSSIPAGAYYFGQGNYTGTTFTGSFNFGQRPFAYAAPSGFKALCDTNLPTPTIAKGSSAFDTVLYTGTGAALTPTSSLEFSPDIVWIKGRSGATDSALYDTVRGATRDLISNNASAETTQAQGLTAFNSNGFTVGTLAKLNTSAATYAGWCWDAGTSTVTNTTGTISAQVRANASVGCSVITYTGNSTAGATVGHGLGVAPRLIVPKTRASASSWWIYHAFMGATRHITLQTATAQVSSSTAWNSTAPSSSVITLGSNNEVNLSSCFAWCFAPVTGFSAFDGYTGNGSADGPFIYSGFKPAFLIIKRTDGNGNWVMIDNKREGYNVDNDPLYANLANAEGTDDLIDIVSNGFKIRSTSADVNTSASTYLYAAFAENPFQYARAR